MGSPKITVGVDLSPFVALDQKVKQMKQKSKELDREMAKAAKKGGVTPDMVKASAGMRQQIEEAEAELNQKKGTEKAMKIAEAREKGEGVGQFEKQVGWAMRANHLIRQASHAAHLQKAFDDTQGDGGILKGIEGIAGLASHIPGPWGKVAKAVEVAAGFANSQYQLRKGETADEQEYRRREKFNDYITSKEKFEHRIMERRLEPFKGGDAGSRELGASLGSLGISGKRSAEMRDAMRFRLQFHEGDALDKLNYTKGIRNAEVEGKLNSKIESTISSARAAEKTAIELGNFDEFRQQEKRIHAMSGGQNIPWRDAGEAWQTELASNFARRNFARSQMMRAGPRTGQ
jgi:hypothetical protein